MDIRLKTYLEVAAERPHPFYARQALRFAYEVGDEAAMQEATRLGALNWKPEQEIRMRSEPEPKIVQLQLFDEAA